MFCPHCGNEVIDSAVICPKCGSPMKKSSVSQGEDKAGPGWIILSILFPLIGAILGIVWILNPDSKRKGKTVLIVSGICLALSIIGWLVILAASASAVDAASYYGYIGQLHLLG